MDSNLSKPEDQKSDNPSSDSFKRILSLYSAESNDPANIMESNQVQEVEEMKNSTNVKNQETDKNRKPKKKGKKKKGKKIGGAAASFEKFLTSPSSEDKQSNFDLNKFITPPQEDSKNSSSPENGSIQDNKNDHNDYQAESPVNISKH